jgi:ribosomal protein L3 glutamine methyltransferase
LAGGGNGMSSIKRILEQAKSYLSEHGALVLEIGNEYENFINIFPELPVTWLEVSSGNQQVLLISSQDLP